MKAKSLLFLLVLCLGFGAYLYYGIQKPSETREADKEKENKIARGDLNDLQHIRIQTPGQKIEIEKVPGARPVWKLTSPVKDLAASGKIDNLQSALGRAKKSKVILEKANLKGPSEKLAQFNLSPPKLILEYKTADLKDPVEIFLGTNNPAMTGTYAQTAQDAEVILATMDLDYLATQVPDDFREMRLTTVDSMDFAEVEIQKPNQNIKFVRDANQQWTMTAPYSNLPVDSEYIRGELQKISFIRANRFLEKNPVALQKPDFKIIVGFKEKVSDERSDHNDLRPHGLEILFGRTAKRLPQTATKAADPNDAFDYYAKSDKTQAALIARFHYDNFSRPAEDYIRKNFEIFDIAQVKQARFQTSKGAPPLQINHEGEGYQIVQGEKKSKGVKLKVETAFSQIRGLRAVKFIKTVDKVPPADFSAEIETGDGRKLQFFMQFQKDFSDLWFVEGQTKMQFLLKKDSLQTKEFSFENLTTEPKADSESKLDQDKDLVKSSDRKK